MNVASVLETEECQLRRQFEGQRPALLGELPLSADLRDRLLLCFNNIRYDDISYAIGWLRKHHPLTLVVHMVCSAIFGYQDGSYWPAVGPLANSQAGQTQLGKAFVGVLRQLGLESFEDVVEAETALKNITPILCHASVPRSALAEFFEHIVEPSLGILALADYEPSALREDLLTTAKPPHVGQPVRRFLKYGGDYALDFARRAGEMLDTARRGVLPSKDDAHGLPKWTIDPFLAWLSSRRAAEGKGDPSPRRARFERPYLHLDAYAASGPLITIALPAQTLDELEGGSDWRGWEWQIRTPEAVTRIPTHASNKIDGSLALAPKEFEVTSRGAHVVQLLQGGAVRLSRTIDSLIERVLFFDVRTGRQCEFGSRLLWCLVDEGWNPVDVQSTTKFINPQGPWASSTVIELDASRLPAIKFTSDDGQHCSYRAPRVTLEGEPSLPTALITDAGSALLFTGEFPKVRAMLAAADLERWTVTLEATGGERLSRAANTLERTAIPGGFLLQPAPPSAQAGDYRIVVHGPLGAAMRASFRYLPGLGVEAPPLGKKPEIFAFRLPKGCDLSATAPLLCENGEDRIIRVKLPTSLATGEIELKSHLSRWRYKLCSRHPSWRVVTGNDINLGGEDWQTDPCRWDTESLAAAFRPVLWLDAAGWLDGRPNATLAIELLDGELQVVASRELPGAATQSLRLDGIEWAALTRSRSLLALTLKEDGREIARATIARIHKGWSPRSLRVAGTGEGTVRISWDQPGGQADCAFRIQSLSQPWSPAIVASIPDPAAGEAVVESELLTCGYYALIPEALDPWGECPKDVLLPELAGGMPEKIWIGSPGQREDYRFSLNGTWRAAVESQLLDTWEIAPEGPAFLQGPIPVLPDDLEAQASAWLWLLQMAGNKTWELLEGKVARQLAGVAPDRIVALALNTPDRFSDRRIAAGLVRAGIALWSSEDFACLPSPVRERLAQIWPACRYLEDPSLGSTLGDWCPWHESQVELVKRRQVNSLRALFQVMITHLGGSDASSDELIVARSDFRLSEAWAREPLAASEVSNWIRRVRPVIGRLTGQMPAGSELKARTKRFENPSPIHTLQDFPWVA